MSDLKTNLQEILQEKQDKIIPENIKKDVQIFDVIGTMNGGIDTSDANATANDIAQNKTAYVNGEKITGTVFTTESGEQRSFLLPSNFTEDETKIILPAMDSGIYYRAGTILYFSKSNLRNRFGLTADKIKSGETILGLEGTVEDVDDYISLPEGETAITIASCIKQIPQLDTSNVTSTSTMFNNCKSLTTIPQLNTSNVINMNGMFQGCSALTEIPLLDTSKCTNMFHMFDNCSSLVTVPVLDTSKCTSIGRMFENCTALSNDSLNNILAMLTNATSYTGTKTLKYIGLSSTQATTCTTLSNWSACEAAGWTTGY